MLANFDWYITPCHNPDGYEYTVRKLYKISSGLRSSGSARNTSKKRNSRLGFIKFVHVQ